MRIPAALSAALLLAACAAAVPRGRAPAPADLAPAEATMRPQPRPAAGAAAAPAPPAGARTAAALDTTSEADKAAARAAASAPAGRALGQVSVALGSPAEPGFWLRGGIVPAAGRGRVVLPSGAAVAVDLIPGEGPALLSLAAFRALGLPLTGLPVVAVYAD